MNDHHIIDAHHLEVVPDGTIITWQRILGDPTSEAVAFVRREVEPTRPGVRPAVVVWVSPGGWDPQTIESAGVTFPCQVVRWGDVSEELIRATDAPAFVETLESGGSYARVAALDAAARVNAGTTASTGAILADADGFLEWLRRDEVAEATPALKGLVWLSVPEDDMDQAPNLGDLAERLRALKSVGVTREALMYAVDRVWSE